MLFVEPTFLFLFLPIVLGLHCVASHRARNLMLLGASLAFYAWGEGPFVAVMVASIAINHGIALWIESRAGTTQPALAIGLTANLLSLSFFKYANFIVDNLNVALGAAKLEAIQLAPVHLPIGVSFFTFQAMAYLVDVSRGECKAQRNPLDTGLYIALFPQLIAGPIVRFPQVAEQIRDRTIKVASFAEGIERFILGLAKKMLLANTAAGVADSLLGLPAHELTQGGAWLAMSCYTLQIYFDFSGYSDMAIGLGLMLGFHFPENFRYPYAAQSITDFWRRWHMSLSSWFRDYLYIPLGGNRGTGLGTYRNLLVVFTLCGLWHGASWNFVIWGLYHGAFLVLERVGLRSILSAVPRVLRHAYTLVVVLVGWVFFRAETLPQALTVLSRMLGRGTPRAPAYDALQFLDAHSALMLLVALVAATPIMLGAARFLGTAGAATGPGHRPSLAASVQGVRILGLGLLMLRSATLVAADTYNPFIYFRF